MSTAGCSAARRRFPRWRIGLRKLPVRMDADKSTARERLRKSLRATLPEDREIWSAKIREHLQASEIWSRADSVMLFASLPDEPDLLPLLKPAEGKRFIFPSLETNRIVARQVTGLESLRAAAYGIREPDPATCPLAEEIDLILVPGLGFGRDGSRLGRGKGFYDRFLGSWPGSAVRCGVCFDCQLSDSLPVNPHDAAMHQVVTQSGVLSVLWGAPAEVAE
jgi:5-formyltetrahydrofolate cyclo-ligase